MSKSSGGFTYVELLVTLAIVAVLASAAFPLSELSARRAKESELRSSLWQLRDAIDAYKRAVDAGHIVRSPDQSGYPATLETLVEGVVDAKDPSGRRMYFLRRVPRDPFSTDAALAAQDTWAKRSYESTAEAPREGKDVFDVYTRHIGVGMNGIPYKEW